MCQCINAHDGLRRIEYLFQKKSRLTTGMTFPSERTMITHECRAEERDGVMTSEPCSIFVFLPKTDSLSVSRIVKEV